MTDKYLVTFKPLGSYFFGDNKSFSEGNYVKSLKMPTSSTILGCLRYNFLKMNLEEAFVTNNFGREYPDFDNHGNAIKNLTGTSKAESLDDNDDNLGVIKNLSPLFLTEQKDESYIDAYFNLPADIQVVKNPEDSSEHKFEFIKTAPEDSVKISINGVKKPYAIITKKNLKAVDKEYLTGTNFWEDYFKGNTPEVDGNCLSKNIFIPHLQTGIALENGVSKDGAFYYKTSYKLKKDFSFALIATLDIKPEHKITKRIDVQLGGEKSFFKMQIKKIADNKSFSNLIGHPVINRLLEPNPAPDTEKKNTNKILAISDILTDNPISGITHANVKYCKSIKHLTKNWKSEAYNLYPAFSVFYPDKNGIYIDTENYRLATKMGFNSIIKIEE